MQAYSIAKIAFVLQFFCCTALQAAAFQSYEFGTPSLGRAAVGQSVVDDASASYFNPAAMSQLNCSEFMLGAELILSKNRFRANTQNTFAGNNGGNAGMLLPGIGIFSVFSADPKLKYGISLTSPFAGSLDYNNGWVGRYFVQSTLLLTLDLNPSVSYSFNDCFSLGAGIILEYARLNQTIGIPPVSTLTGGEGQADLRLQQVAPGFNLGMFFEPNCDTKLGISYRSKIHHRLKGRTTFLNLAFEPQTTAILKLPQGLIASMSYNVHECLRLLAEIGWTNWKIFKNTIITIDNLTLAIPRKWKDTYRLGAGLQQKLNDTLILQLGASYDSSPTKAINRLPDLPMDRQIRLSTGLICHVYQNVDLSFNYQYMNLGKASIHNINRLGTLSGKYPKNSAQFFGVSTTFKF